MIALASDHGGYELKCRLIRHLEERGLSYQMCIRDRSQIVGYIMSGDPTYITSYRNARGLIGRVERDELVEEMFKDYIENNHWKQKK